jgi:hypothetical protein
MEVMGLPMVQTPKRPLGLFREEQGVTPIPGFCLVADMSMVVTKGDAKNQTRTTKLSMGTINHISNIV